MEKSLTLPALALGLSLSAGLLATGLYLKQTALELKASERTVTVKGLAEQDVDANIAIWPIRFTEVENDLPRLYDTLEQKSAKVLDFLKQQGFDDSEISLGLPAIEDRQAQGYADPNLKYRYTAKVTISLYSSQVARVLETRRQLATLAREGIAIGGNDYENRTEFLYTDLNAVKPAMVQLATENAREVADKFAHDSGSHLGKIKSASQGQFTISDRDSNSPQIKRIRVVSTVTYYLTD
ncbi:SIMPL domain-containing protein [Shewanella cyperi]|uniref:SIMPL domain-containing protein n=1 Tax=Shewanella cyperi TaxID=2814292 RepID=UPI001A941078|nr:SIMPL domain-containing protein [Shewanella cyperi]QSX39587.1 SIMPL domain-containing protein [Shewanella cyperi]